MARLAWAGSLLGLAILTRQTSAALAIGLCRGDALEKIAREANAVGALVASRRGAAPKYTREELAEFSRTTG